MANYQEARVKLRKTFEDQELPHELFLTTRQRTKIRNDFASNVKGCET